MHTVLFNCYITHQGILWITWNNRHNSGVTALWLRVSCQPKACVWQKPRLCWLWRNYPVIEVVTGWTSPSLPMLSPLWVPPCLKPRSSDSCREPLRHQGWVWQAQTKVSCCCKLIQWLLMSPGSCSRSNYRGKPYKSMATTYRHRLTPAGNALVELVSEVSKNWLGLFASPVLLWSCELSAREVFIKQRLVKPGVGFDLECCSQYTNYQFWVTWLVVLEY